MRRIVVGLPLHLDGTPEQFFRFRRVAAVGTQTPQQHQGEVIARIQFQRLPPREFRVDLAVLYVLQKTLFLVDDEV